MVKSAKLILLLLGLMLVSIACSSASPPATAQNETSSPTVLPDTDMSQLEPISTEGEDAVESLRKRAEEANHAMNSDGWLEYYEFTSPRFRSICKSGDFAVETGMGVALLIGFMGLSEETKLEWALKDVQVTGSEGRVFTEISHDGKPIEFGESSNEGGRWVLLDGEWWVEDEDWQEGCPGLVFDQSTDNADSPPAQPLISYSMLAPITVETALMEPLFGEPNLNGSIILTFLSVEKSKEVDDLFTGENHQPKGVFIAVHFSIENQANSRIQPGTQINNGLSLMDESNRRWTPTSSGFIASTFSSLQGGSTPQEWVAPGFGSTTAIVFDVPEDATNLRLESERLGISISLGSLKAIQASENLESASSQASGEWAKRFQIGVSQTHGGITVTVMRAALATPELLLPDYSSADLSYYGFGDAIAILGLAVKVTNGSDQDVTLYPGGFGTRLVVGNEQSEPSPMSETGGDFLAGVSKEFQIWFPLNETPMDEIDLFRYKFSDYVGGEFDFRINLSGDVLPAMVPTQIAVPAPGTVRGYTRTDSASIGVELFLKSDGTFDNYEAKVVLLGVVRGKAAAQMVTGDSEIYSVINRLDPGFEYILAKINFDYLKGATQDKIFNLSPFDFTAVSADGKEYDSALVFGLDPDLSADLYPGASHEGWAAFQVAQDDPAPLLTFGRGYSGGGGLWWKLYE